MKKTGVITDSNSGISQKEAKDLGIWVLPMPFYCEDTCYYEGVSLTREMFFENMKNGKHFSTSQPSPEDVCSIWREGLKEYEEIVYIPMSSALSGSCATAYMLSQTPEFENKVFVVDNGRVATPMRCSIMDALELAEAGYSGAEIQQRLNDHKDQMVIYIGVETLEHLKRGGRISSTSALMGNILNIKPVLKFDIGLLETYSKCRGIKKARKEMLQAMKHELETRFKDAAASGKLQLLAASSADEEGAKDWVREIEEYFPDYKVIYDDLSLVLCCHIGENGLGIGVSVKEL